jgi:hypothetical protein
MLPDMNRGALKLRKVNTAAHCYGNGYRHLAIKISGKPQCIMTTL